jgi:hypothetical protein
MNTSERAGEITTAFISIDQISFYSTSRACCDVQDFRCLILPNRKVIAAVLLYISTPHVLNFERRADDGRTQTRSITSVCKYSVS